jgi:hypothetical protein
MPFRKNNQKKATNIKVSMMLKEIEANLILMYNRAGSLNRIRKLGMYEDDDRLEKNQEE